MQSIMRFIQMLKGNLDLGYAIDNRTPDRIDHHGTPRYAAFRAVDVMRVDARAWIKRTAKTFGNCAAGTVGAPAGDAALVSSTQCKAARPFASAET
jgi:hypothetical protein